MIISKEMETLHTKVFEIVNSMEMIVFDEIEKLHYF